MSDYNKVDAVERLRKSRRTVPRVDGREGLRRVPRLRTLLKRFWPGVFMWPWYDDLQLAVDKLEECMVDGGMLAVALPRGGGKTVIGECASILGVLLGWRKFVVPIAAENKDAVGKLMQSIKMSLRFNAGIRETWPQLAAFVERAEGKAAKSKTLLTPDGDDALFVWEQERIVLPTMDGMPWSGAVIDCRGLTSAILGLHHTDRAGTVKRPDFAFLDDPQTRESAKSDTQTATREDLVVAGVLGLAGPGVRMAAYCACTVIKEDDLSARLTDRKRHPEWNGIRRGMVRRWPTAQDTLWSEYADILRDAQRRGVDKAERVATEFYRRNRAAMDAGADMSWKHRKRTGELSAVQCAENLLLEVGIDGFASEYQNEPRQAQATLYDLTATIIKSRVNGRQALVAADDAKLLVAGADINHYGIHWVLMALANDATAGIVGYGRYPERGSLVERNASEAEIDAGVAAGIARLCEVLNDLRVTLPDGRPLPLAALAIDRAYRARTVQGVAGAALQTYQVIPCFGYDSISYSPAAKSLIGEPGHNCHVSETRYGPCLMFDADYWRATAQRAWLPVPGARGGLTAYGRDQEEHAELAEQICRERLSEMLSSKRGWVYRWTTAPGWHDYGDAVYLAMVAAAYRGIYPAAQRAGEVGPAEDTEAPPRPAVQETQEVTYLELQL